MLEIECESCKKRFFVKGHTTPDTWTEPGEVVTDLECYDELCQCLQDGESYVVVGEDRETFDDDVI